MRNPKRFCMSLPCTIFGNVNTGKSKASQKKDLTYVFTSPLCMSLCNRIAKLLFSSVLSYFFFTIMAIFGFV